MRIAEIFRSLQGEGQWAGSDSVFVRTSGCNLRCGFCDTPYTSWEPEGDDLAFEEILSRALELDAQHVVITGGEPMLHAELVPLTAALRTAGRVITIETAGTLDLPVTCDLMSISPKLSNSTPDPLRAPKWRERHERTRQRPDVLRRLVRDYPFQCKFVVAAETDLAEIEDFLTRIPEIERDQVWLMPEGTNTTRLAAIGTWLEPYCRARGYHFCPRLHIAWFGPGRGV
ncbi:MAG: 7-carboxy-7-deazaguanine synthase QueE [Pirellulales bacterium]|nr:7-carboxy-7-deazaguanine synthase QueE [Pirellulales bacterium]